MIGLKRAAGAALLLALAADLAYAAPATVAGRPVQCQAANGAAVRTVENRFLPNVGRAYMHPVEGPVIELNPLVLSGMPEGLQLFWFAHECAHHSLGHTLGAPARTHEAEADCWAIRTARNRRWLDRSILVQMEPFFRNQPASFAGHLAGPDRLRWLADCFNS